MRQKTEEAKQQSVPKKWIDVEKVAKELATLWEENSGPFFAYINAHTFLLTANAREIRDTVKFR